MTEQERLDTAKQVRSIYLAYRTAFKTEELQRQALVIVEAMDAYITEKELAIEEAIINAEILEMNSSAALTAAQREQLEDAVRNGA